MILAFGDALALCVSSLRGFNKQNFAQFHPAGALGKRLLLTVQNIMHTGQALPCIPEDALFQDVLYAITSKKLGTCIVTDKNNILQGIITDGDLRRACTAHGAAIFNTQARDIMTSNPKTTRPQELAINALDRMEKHNITSLIVTQDNKIQGLIHIHDLIKAGLSS
jgi:arabinose-5-phosphate isomerase